jgi:hypothetical protein
MPNNKFPHKKKLNGQPNPKYIDVCEEDPPIAGQKFACMSFISPEKILKKRELFLFAQFVKQWDMYKSMEKFGGFINFISYKYKLNVEEIMADFKEFSKEEEKTINSQSVEDDYKNFLDKREERLNEIFNREHSFQTSVRGVKVRGVFSTQDEAEMKCKSLRETDPSHDIFVGPVGQWLSWDPDAYKTGRVEFLEEELNQLHHEKLKNEKKAKEEFDQRVKDAKYKAIEENIKKANTSGNTLTQTINEDGNLIGANTINFEEREVADDKHDKEDSLKQNIGDDEEKTESLLEVETD